VGEEEMKFIVINKERERLNVDEIASWKPETQTLRRELHEPLGREMQKVTRLPSIKETVLRITTKDGRKLKLCGALADDAIKILEALK
jgi:hypothetical protein